MKKTILFIVILIFVSLLSAGAVWYAYTRPIAITDYPGSEFPKPQYQPPAVPSGVSTTTPIQPTPSNISQAPINNSKWQTYTNKKYSFSLKLPLNLNVASGISEFQPKSIYFNISSRIDSDIFWIRIDDIDTFIDFFHEKQVYEKLLVLNKNFEGYVPEVHNGFPYSFIEQKLKINGIPALDRLAYGDAGRAVFLLVSNKVFTIFHNKTYITQTYPPKKIDGIGSEFEEILRSIRFLK